MQATARTVPDGGDDYITNVTFPADYKVGDYIEFLKVNPYDAGASGYYEISISYTRGNIAAAATHLASITHYDPAVWREVGRVNNNVYVGADGYNFTIDCNTQYGNPKLRIRAVNTYGIATPLFVNIKVHPININASWSPLNNTGSDLTVNSYLPMTNDWSLLVGNPYFADGAKIALHATGDGNVGIGTMTPQERLSVNGNIRAKEIKVETQNWPDYVFTKDHELAPLDKVEAYIKENQHLPDVPSAAKVAENGVGLGEMNALLLKKIEELTLYVIQQGKEIDSLKKQMSSGKAK